MKAKARTRILGFVGMLWGGAIVLRTFWAAGVPTAASPFGAGQWAGLGIGIIMLAAGVWAVAKTR